MRIRVFRDACPNCESAWTGGHHDPERLEWCVVCSDPNTGKIRGWVWRWPWLHRILVSDRNFAFYNRIRAVRSTWETT